MQGLRAEPPQLLLALDKTIVDLSYDFRGDGAFSFAIEADVQYTLLGRLRANVLFHLRAKNAKIELVHAEFPAFGVSWKGGARHDLTVVSRFRAALDFCRKALDRLWPAGEGGTAPGKGKESVLVPLDGGGTQVSGNPAGKELADCLLCPHGDTSVVETLWRVSPFPRTQNGRKC